MFLSRFSLNMVSIAGTACRTLHPQHSCLTLSWAITKMVFYLWIPAPASPHKEETWLSFSWAHQSCPLAPSLHQHRTVGKPWEKLGSGYCPTCLRFSWQKEPRAVQGTQWICADHFTSVQIFENCSSLGFLMFISINCICEKTLYNAKQSLPHFLKVSGRQKFLQPTGRRVGCNFVPAMTLNFNFPWSMCVFGLQASSTKKYKGFNCHTVKCILYIKAICVSCSGK